MCTLYERLAELCRKKGIKGARMCTDLGLSKSLMTDLKHGRKKTVSAPTAQKIASYFGVSVAYLLGEEEPECDPIQDEEIKFALFRGREDVTEEMYQEVLDFAQFVLAREEKRRQG